MNEKWGDDNILIHNELSSYYRELFYEVKLFAKKNEF